jgi:hypothetical protein
MGVSVALELIAAFSSAHSESRLNELHAVEASATRVTLAGRNRSSPAQLRHQTSDNSKVSDNVFGAERDGLHHDRVHGSAKTDYFMWRSSGRSGRFIPKYDLRPRSKHCVRIAT